MSCFDKTIWACQNRYWVNTTRFDMMGGVSGILEMPGD